MKRFLGVLFAVLTISAISSAQLRWGFGAQGGISISAFPEAVKDYYGLGYGFGAHADADINKYFTVRFNFDYHMFGADKDKFKNEIARQIGVPASDVTFEGLTVNIMGISLNGLGKLPTDGPFSPYALVGVGMNILSTSEPKITVQGQSVQATKPESETKFGLNFGAGAEYAVSKNVCLGLEFRYVMIFTETKNTAHMPISFTFTYHP